MRKRSWGLLAAALLIIGVAAGGWALRHKGQDALPYKTEPIQRGDIHVQVSATGTLNAVTTVAVGTQVSGTISVLHVDYNDRVKKGEILAQLDPTFLREQLAQSEADLEKAKVQVRQAERDWTRLQPLQAQGLASQVQIDQAQTALEAAKADEKSSEAAEERAKTNLNYATITSPIDGVVVARSVDVGQTVAASLQAPTLFSIANDLTQMQLEADVDEADIGQVKDGQAVNFTVDAFPERTFHGKVFQIRLGPQTIQNVVTYTVIVRVDNPDLSLLPGMTANATFLVDDARNVLKVPSQALRFRPPGANGRNGQGAAGRAAEAAVGGTPAQAAAAGGHGAGGQGAGGQGPGGQGWTGGQHGDHAKGAAIYVLGPNGKPRRVHVTQGISDGTFTAVSSDSLSEGMPVILAMNASAAGAQQQGAVNPFMPGGGRARGR